MKTDLSNENDNDKPVHHDLVLTNEQIKSMKGAFEAQKSYKDGKIDITDYGSFLTAIQFPYNEEQLNGYVKYLETTNSDGKVRFEQFARIAAVQHDPKETLKVYAKDFDKNADGFISPDESELGMNVLRSHYDSKHFSKDALISFEKFVEEADTNKDGKVSIEELNVWLDKFFEK